MILIIIIIFYDSHKRSQADPHTMTYMRAIAIYSASTIIKMRVFFFPRTSFRSPT